MSVTANEVFMITLSLSGDLDENGQPEEVDDYKVRTPGILTALQAEHIKTGDLFNTFEIANKPVTNMLGSTSGHDYVEFLGEDITKETIGSVKATILKYLTMLWCTSRITPDHGTPLPLLIALRQPEVIRHIKQR
jgi:hypothetical protein